MTHEAKNSVVVHFPLQLFTQVAVLRPQRFQHLAQFHDIIFPRNPTVAQTFFH